MSPNFAPNYDNDVWLTMDFINCEIASQTQIDDQITSYPFAIEDTKVLGMQLVINFRHL